MVDNHTRSLWQKRGAKCIKNLEKHGFQAQFTQTSQEATSLIMEMISGFKTFGFAGSDTTRVLELPKRLKEMGKLLYDHWDEGLSSDELLEIRQKQSQCDCFICSANAISISGEIVNMDGVGNRTNAMSFGPQKVIIVAGMNKVTHDLESAFKRIHEVAAPKRAASLGLDTPCAKTGVCTDCNDPMRICRISTVLHRRPMHTDISVVLINETLGF